MFQLTLVPSPSVRPRSFRPASFAGCFGLTLAVSLSFGFCRSADAATSLGELVRAEATQSVDDRDDGMVETSVVDLSPRSLSRLLRRTSTPSLPRVNVAAGERRLPCPAVTPHVRRVTLGPTARPAKQPPPPAVAPLPRLGSTRSTSRDDTAVPRKAPFRVDPAVPLYRPGLIEHDSTDEPTELIEHGGLIELEYAAAPATRRGDGRPTSRHRVPSYVRDWVAAEPAVSAVKPPAGKSPSLGKRASFGKMPTSRGWIRTIGYPLPGKPVQTRARSNPVAGAGQAQRLRELALQSQREATGYLRRDAVHSARRSSLAALKHLIDARDAESGGNANARLLDSALDAIRESADFIAHAGTHDPRALARMVAAHETAALRHRDLTSISLTRAREAYLATASDRLVMACGSSMSCGEVLLILGIIESRIARSPAHGDAVQLALHRTAVRVAPNYARAHRVLAATLLRVRQPGPAGDHFRRSLQLRPGRAAVEGLMVASRRIGDVQTAQKCAAALNDSDLPSDLPIEHLTPNQFAATHRPAPVARDVSTDASRPAAEPPVSKSASRFFPFWSKRR